MAAGRPKKYNKKSLQAEIDRYFRGICRMIEAKDGLGRTILNDLGVPLIVTEYVRPPSVSALCLFLGIDRSTWQNYGDRTKHPELCGIVAEAKLRMEAYLEEELVTREKNVNGIIFNLQNNYGWRQKQEVELGEKTRQDMNFDGMSIRDKLALLAEQRGTAEKMLGEAENGQGEDGKEE